MRIIMRVKRRSHKFVPHKFVPHKFVPHKFFIVPCVTMHKALERINKKSHKFIQRPVLTNSHKFVTHIKMSLYDIIKGL